MAAVEPSVLVVDDDPLESELFVRMLRECGFENRVQVLTNCDEAKCYLRGDAQFADRARFSIPALVVLDHRMPGETGWDLLEWMRRDPALRNLPAIVFSASGRPADEAKATELGAAYQVKPHDPAEYSRIVSRMGEFWLRGGALQRPS